jgi:uncharacterized glyoxalase superfamily protein PhnB
MVGQPIRDGFQTITPYLMVQDVDAAVAFLKEAFGATEQFRTTGGGGNLHVEVQIGDSMLMLGGGNEEPRPVALFLYIEDVDAVYERALAAGATSLLEPADGLFGEARGAGVKDPFGNEWYMGKHRAR